MPAHTALNRLYPYRLMLPKEGTDSVSNLFQSLNIEVPKEAAGQQRITSITRETDGTSKGEGLMSGRKVSR